MPQITCDHCESKERVRRFARAKNETIQYEYICYDCATYIVDVNKKMRWWVGE